LLSVEEFQAIYNLTITTSGYLKSFVKVKSLRNGVQVTFPISSAHAYVVVICIERSENESVVIFPDQYLGFQVSLAIIVSYPPLYSEVYVVWCDSFNISEELKVSRTHSFLPLGVPVPVELSPNDLPATY
jgi:hypothetical protein